MSEPPNRPLRVFLCHASQDKPLVHELYQQLSAEDWIDPWLDEEKLFPGMDWNLEIEKAVEAADAILVCLSNNSITKEGYVQRELRTVLDYADYKPEGTLYVIPVRLEACEPPRRLRIWHYADYFPENNRGRSYNRLLVSLRNRANTLGISTGKIESNQTPAGPVEAIEEEQIVQDASSKPLPLEDIQGRFPGYVAEQSELFKEKLTIGDFEFVFVSKGNFIMGSGDEDKQAFDNEKPQDLVGIPYDYYIARFPITNEQYASYIEAKGLKHPLSGWEIKRDHPVVNISWTDAMAYCRWLNELLKNGLPSAFVLRLPTEAEWEKAARGTNGLIYPWGNAFDKNKCNTYEGGKGDTTPVAAFSPQGDSPYGCADMSGNIWEWTHSIFKAYAYNVNDGRESEWDSSRRVLRGGSFHSDERGVRCACRMGSLLLLYTLTGFRVVATPPLL